ncbi:MAG: class I SAM-dependent methyltransferase [Patescibacteria group bacterium]
MQQLRNFIEKYVYAGFGTLWILVSSLFLGRSRGKLAQVAEYFGWKNPLKSYPLVLPKIGPATLFPGVIPLDLYDPVGQDGNASLLELVILNHLVRVSKASSIFEFGTFDGRTTLNLAANTPENARIYTLDLPDEEVTSAKANPLGDTKFTGKVETGYKYKRHPLGKKVVQLLGDSVRFDFSAYKNSVDFIFVDAAHTYPYVMSDTRAALEMLRPDGIVLWHDYRSSCEGVSTALNELFSKGGVYGKMRHIEGTNLAVLLPDDFARLLAR